MGVYCVGGYACTDVGVGGVVADMSTEGRGGAFITQVSGNGGWSLLAWVCKKQVEKMLCFYSNNIKLHAKHDQLCVILG